MSFRRQYSIGVGIGELLLLCVSQKFIEYSIDLISNNKTFIKYIRIRILKSY